MARHLVVFVALLLVIAVPGPCAGQGNGKFNQIFVFGDSLSDTGNLQFYTQPPKYTVGRFTDGADTKPAAQNALYRAGGGYNVVWHEQLAKMLGLPAASPSLLAGNKQNSAYGGATTGDGTTRVYQSQRLNVDVPNMGKQVADFAAKGNVPSMGLYILWGGGNDLRNVFFHSYDEGMNNLQGITKAAVINAADQAAKNIANEIDSLVNGKGGGATKFLWPDLPPLDLTPRFLAVDNMKLGDKTTIGDDLAAAVKEFNADEVKQIDALQKEYADQGVKIVDLDVFGAVNDIINGVTKNGSFAGYTNVTAPADKLAANANPDTYLFWDEFHPTSHAHYDIAKLAQQALKQAGLSAVPEPSTLVLAGIAVALTAARVLRRRARPVMRAGSPAAGA